MLNLQKEWLEIVKTHNTYQFWSEIIGNFPKKIIGQTYLHHSKPMESSRGIYLSNYLTFIFIHDDDSACLLSTNPDKMYQMMTKDMKVRKGTNIVVNDNNSEFCSLIGKLANADDDGIIHLHEPNSFNFPLFDKLFNTSLESFGYKPESKIETKPVIISTPKSKLQDSMKSFNAKPTPKPMTETLIKIAQFKKYRKGNKFIAEKLGISIQDVENYLAVIKKNDIIG